MDNKRFLSIYQKKEVEVFQDISLWKPKVSVCIQTYQHVYYIKQCLDGILMQQTTFPFEILLGDDASTDGTREICKKYAHKHPDKIRFFLHHRENNIAINGNPTGRFNFIYNLYNARGNYIALCEGDDYWTDPLKLQKQVDFLEENPDYGLCFTRFEVKDEKEGIFKEDKNGHYFDDFRKHIVFDFEKFAKGWYGGMPTLVFRKSSFNIAKATSYKYFRDVHLITELLSNGKGICLNMFTTVYRLHDGGIYTSTNNLDRARIGKLCYQEIYNHHKKNTWLLKKYNNFQINYINELMKHNFKFNAGKEILEYGMRNNDLGFIKSNLKKILSKTLIYRAFNKITKKKYKTPKFPGSKDYWENRYRNSNNSGSGSYGRLADFKAEVLNDFVKKNNIKSILEFGCGDGNQLSFANYPNYIGVDVSVTAIELCKAKFDTDTTKAFYLAKDFQEKEVKVELVLSLDVLFHLIEDHVFETYMEDLFKTATHYVIIYSSNYEENIAPHVRSRKFTDWVDKNQMDSWVLKQTIKNKYQFNPDDPDHTSMSDFYIYQKINK